MLIQKNTIAFFCQIFYDYLYKHLTAQNICESTAYILYVHNFDGCLVLLDSKLTGLLVAVGKTSIRPTQGYRATRLDCDDTSGLRNILARTRCGCVCVYNVEKCGK